ncbi:unnamed protein product [Protopolystoma xenopodis]|uniref:Uncharacterized protein n=1 Tax=Protopolystoma xenopodis TaxID=117903 RepID=A0A3S5FCE3_9PLAT|nr:unnamed protein product [Protopolystoma xenopodis]
MHRGSRRRHHRLPLADRQTGKHTNTQTEPMMSRDHLNLSACLHYCAAASALSALCTCLSRYHVLEVSGSQGLTRLSASPRLSAASLLITFPICPVIFSQLLSLLVLMAMHTCRGEREIDRDKERERERDIERERIAVFLFPCGQPHFRAWLSRLRTGSVNTPFALGLAGRADAIGLDRHPNPSTPCCFCCLLPASGPVILIDTNSSPHLNMGN